MSGNLTARVRVADMVAEVLGQVETSPDGLRITGVYADGTDVNVTVNGVDFRLHVEAS